MRLTVYFPEDSPTTHELVDNQLTIGRLGDNDVKIDEDSVSSHHAEIQAQNGGAILRDLDSTNGTFLNGEALKGEAPIVEGDEIYFGNVRSVFMEKTALPSVVEESEEALTPLPASASTGNGRPENFRYMSPFEKEQKPKDTLALAAWVLAAIAVAAAVFALLPMLAAS